MPGKDDVLRRAGLPANSALVDDTVARGIVKETAVFQVPLSISEERIRFDADKFQRKFGKHLEAQGFTVLAMSQPVLDKRSHVKCAPDRKQYAILAVCRRRPVTQIIDVPDAAVPGLLARGMRLAD